MSLYDADGNIRTTTVNGVAYTGLYAADQSINVVQNDVINFGVMHPCGALRVNTSTGETYYDASGAVYLNRL